MIDLSQNPLTRDLIEGAIADFTKRFGHEPNRLILPIEFGIPLATIAIAIYGYPKQVAGRAWLGCFRGCRVVYTTRPDLMELQYVSPER